MKKLLFTAIALFLMGSCNKDKAKFIVEDFSETRTVTLSPYRMVPYAMMNVWVEGYTNDTILIYLHSTDGKPILQLRGVIKERWYTDYYGEGERTFIFDPYEATEGELEIRFSLD